ncbi:phage portal protein [Amycolatopsis vastitatis]|uniref:Phage portal protein n=1 Tax=Amycolatopsis vastitatis TaxID=1905142 RepID=A0A229TEG9_9PSEU|nr:phage portal protein [Amycolatopsis vastitatis]OXM69636.1 phage portal protein [Amycolatopsis vastitatis]
MPFVISQGVLEAVHQYQTATIPVGGAVVLADGVARDYASIWRTQPQVRTVVSFLARNIAQLGIHVYRRLSDVDRVRLADHPLAALLSRPNPFTTRYRLIEALVSDLAIYDNAILAKTAAGVPALVRLDPRYVTPISSNQFTVETYRYRGTTGYRDIPAAQVVHFRGYNPEDGRWGCSPMETLRRILSEEFQAGHYREQLWRNGARLMGYLQRPVDAPEWGKGARDRFRRSWQEQYTGNGGKAGGTPILEDGMTFVPASVTPEAAQYIEARKLTREEVASAFHIPLPMVGILDHATYSNITEQHKNLYQDTLGPWLTMITEELHLQLVPDFPDAADVYLEFNLAEKLRGSFEEQAAQLQTATGAPWMTRNEARARVNLPQIDGGDELVTPLNVLTGGQASPTDTAPEPKTVLATATRLLEGVTR